MENKLFELAARRRSVRRYTNEHIDDTVIEEIMKVALTAPASFGHQPVEFVVVRDKRAIKEIAACKSLGGSQSHDHQFNWWFGDAPERGGLLAPPKGGVESTILAASQGGYFSVLLSL